MSLGYGSAMSSWGGTSGLPGLGFFCRCFGVVLQMLSIWIWDTLGRGEASSCLFSWVQEREVCRSFQGQPRQRGQPDSKGCPLLLHGPVLLGLAVTMLVARLPYTLCFVRKVDPASPAPITDQTAGRHGCTGSTRELAGPAGICTSSSHQHCSSSGQGCPSRDAGHLAQGLLPWWGWKHPSVLQEHSESWMRRWTAGHLPRGPVERDTNTTLGSQCPQVETCRHCSPSIPD